MGWRILNTPVPDVHRTLIISRISKPTEEIAEMKSATRSSYYQEEADYVVTRSFRTVHNHKEVNI